MEASIDDWAPNIALWQSQLFLNFQTCSLGEAKRQRFVGTVAASVILSNHCEQCSLEPDHPTATKGSQSQ
ncbi:hypothetical protein HZ326_2081 [Fusarium oxysporum f. sp. albedinis]|nr:hypothetical protein HZ326_2081 [Fusarium oxysporum f. sp. albedinis]